MSLVIGIIIGSFTAMILIVIIVLKVSDENLVIFVKLITFSLCSSGIFVCLFASTFHNKKRRFVLCSAALDI